MAVVPNWWLPAAQNLRNLALLSMAISMLSSSCERRVLTSRRRKCDDCLVPAAWCDRSPPGLGDKQFDFGRFLFYFDGRFIASLNLMVGLVSPTEIHH